MSKPSTSATQNLKLALSRGEAGRALGVSAITVDRLTKRGLRRTVPLDAARIGSLPRGAAQCRISAKIGNYAGP